ncbi:MAG: ribulokinase [Armatimonadota bacterium]|nr:ribulokinase [Armatimonadota bacterium]MDR7467743.1 ribulokinase [Armatimonadota bacterium]MDR7494943.1 ribulokinase [Armatimonadota bacterium]MDR7499792.1 ribulokinase [Armatimonadota bacterium]MDR7505262.1 ribulokinase [Armatimonadota bacterium]
MPGCTIGIDFGTESARAVLVDVADGRLVTTATFAYPHGVIDRVLPGGAAPLPPDYALQDPQDWLEALEALLRQMAAAAPAEEIIGIGVDFTSCTVLPTTADGTPLCMLSDYRGQPHAWPKLWKHHAAQPYADRINAAAGRPGGEFLRFYGGKTSSEWLWAKGWQFLAEAPALAEVAERWIEGGDWIVWRLAGREIRSACQAGYKAHWQKDAGYPPAAFWQSLDPVLPALLTRLGEPHPVGVCAGTLTPEWARRTGLRPEAAVAVAVIDAHAGMPALGISAPGRLMAIMGTSTCHLLVDPNRFAVQGISGVVEDGILPGFFGYEAGQVSVGDIFQWFVRTSRLTFQELEAEAGRLAPGESGVLALDWWNGCRTPLVDADLSGLLVGLTLATEPAHIYRALLESTAFGTRRVIETFEAGGVAVREVHACGGLAERSPLLLQITADVLDREVLAAPLPHASAVGAAIYAAAAAGEEAGGYTGVVEATEQMGNRSRIRYAPRPEAREIYDALYRHYLELAHHFGEGGTEVMKALRRFRSRTRGHR